jgi:hypothetical protein
MTSGLYDLTWYDVTNGNTVVQTNIDVEAGNVTWSKPVDIGNELAVYIRRLNRLISGLGETSGGYIEAFAEDYSHTDWVRVAWSTYNAANGEARVATGDIDGDGRDEIVVGLGPVSGDPSLPGGWYEVLDDDYTHLAWGHIGWSSYNGANGESWPAVKK